MIGRLGQSSGGGAVSDGSAVGVKVARVANRVGSRVVVMIAPGWEVLPAEGSAAVDEAAAVALTGAVVVLAGAFEAG